MSDILTSKSPMNILFDQAEMKCTICNTSTKVGCDCWTKCQCGWSFEKNTSCNNPKCGGDPNAPQRAIMTGSGKI